MKIASRTIGGLCSRLFEYGLATSLEELVLSHAVGAPLQFGDTQQAAGVLMIPTPKAGILRRVEGVRAAGEVPYIEEVTIQVRERYQLVPLPEGSSYLGFVFARAPRPEQAEAALRQAQCETERRDRPVVERGDRRRRVMPARRPRLRLDSHAV